MEVFCSQQSKDIYPPIFPSSFPILIPLSTFPVSFPTRKKKKKIGRTFSPCPCPSGSITELKGQKAYLSSDATLNQANFTKQMLS